MNSVKCPVCSKSAKGPISTYTVEESASHICTKERDASRFLRLKEVIANLWPDGKCEIYQCTNCGFGFGVPFIGGNEAYYKILHEQMGYPRWKWEYDYGISKISLKENDKILDIGAGSGYFLDSLDKNITKYAVESTPTTAKELEKKEIKCYSDFNQLLRDEEGNLDAITMFQVLEHISDFNEVLKNCFRLLKSNGKLVISVPNADSMFKQEEIIGHADMPPNHINKWTIKSLKIACESVGLKMHSKEFEPGNFNSLKAKIHMRTLVLSQKKGSLFNLIYRVKSKKIRSLLLLSLAPLVMLSMLKHWSYLKEGGSFSFVAIK